MSSKFKPKSHIQKALEITSQQSARLAVSFYSSYYFFNFLQNTGIIEHYDQYAYRNMAHFMAWIYGSHISKDIKIFIEKINKNQSNISPTQAYIIVCIIRESCQSISQHRYIQVDQLLFDTIWAYTYQTLDNIRSSIRQAILKLFW